MNKLNLQDDTLTIPAGDSVIRSVYGDYIYNLDSEADLKISIGSQRPIQFKQGIGYKLPSGVDFMEVRIINNTASDVQCTISYGEGDILDRRFNASGNLKVINALGTVLKTDDDASQVILTAIRDAVQGTLAVDDNGSQTILSAIETALGGTLKVDDDASQALLTAIRNELQGTLSVDDDASQTLLTAIRNELQGTLSVDDNQTQAKLDDVISELQGTLKVDDDASQTLLTAIRNELQGTLSVDDNQTQTRLDTIEASLTAIENLIKNDQDQRAPLNVVGGSFAEQIGSGTNTVVTSGANTSGVIIRTVSLRATGTTKYADLLIGGNVVYRALSNSSCDNISINSPIFVPSGNSVQLLGSTAGQEASITYDVL